MEELKHWSNLLGKDCSQYRSWDQIEAYIFVNYNSQEGLQEGITFWTGVEKWANLWKKWQKKEKCF